ncbi:MAG: DUF72 domain-containing protein [bacterium]|nr:DUF72 domain-containing protein [bacterium]
MQVYVGTSGWRYSWNLGNSLDWYIKNSNLNAVELNASFYRFPFPSQIKGWAKSANGLRWAVKVTRRVTHLRKFGEESYSTWDAFKSLFEPLDFCIDFYLFQLPPSIKTDFKDKIEKFVIFTNLGQRFALEPRNISWFVDETVDWAKSLGITLVSVDAPNLPRTIFNINGVVYLRMHGRDRWYAHDYTENELREVAEKILETKPEKIYVFFNNNHAMLKNAQEMLKILRTT